MAIRLAGVPRAVQHPVATNAPEFGVQPTFEPIAERSAKPGSELSPAEPMGASAAAFAGHHRYVVQPGDTVQSIAERQGVRATTLASVNDLVDPDLLQPGRELLVPVTDGLVHVVHDGENLRAIAERYGVDVDAIVSVNDLATPDQIAVGLRLFVPSASPVSPRPADEPVTDALRARCCH
jgi:LysM repeat protein